eukprot:3267819-Alexandrium_andersonii.AAC.1
MHAAPHPDTPTAPQSQTTPSHQPAQHVHPTPTPVATPPMCVPVSVPVSVCVPVCVPVCVCVLRFES